MKVDIITRHSVPNYGSLLQSYATQKTIEKMGFESEIIDYVRYDERKNTLVNSMITGKKWNKNLLMRIIYKAIQGPNYGHMFSKFSEYRKNFLKVTNINYGNIEEIKNDLPEADVYCSGSDQIWGKVGTANIDEAYFLKFVENKNKRCIAYASSFGKAILDKEFESKLPKLLKNYDKILVREDSAKKIIKNVGINNVEQVLDPTFLLEKEEWLELINKTKPINQKYVLVYQLHDNKEFEKYAEEFAKRAKLKLIRLSGSIYHIFRTGKLIYLPDQYEFLRYFNDAQYILTDSFHATAFSLILNKNFVDILPGKTSTRITSILKLTELEDRILKDYNDFSYIEENIDFKNCNNILNKERQRSLKLFKDAIVGNENNIDLNNKHYNCTGCRACEKLCPSGAIEMEEDDEGFIIPKVDKTKCTNCGLCLKRCPQLNSLEIKNTNQQVIAAKSKDESIRVRSSSGGIFSMLADYIIENNGIVYGAKFDKDLNLIQKGVYDKKELDALRGSKYIQSDTLNTYKEVKENLKDEKIVLYVGTPCQISGLKRYLGKEYRNLLTIDVICHGVPSQKLFKKYIRWIENKEKSEIVSYEFRNKEKSGWGYNIKIFFENNKRKYINYRMDPYYKSFIEGNTFRECCYNCKYANTNRVGDITIGDFWGIEKEIPAFYDDKGVSVIIINNKNGQEYFNKIKDNLLIKNSTIEQVKKYNNNLNNPSQRNNIRNKSYLNLDNFNFEKYCKKSLLFKREPKDILKNMIPYKVKKILKGVNKK